MIAFGWTIGSAPASPCIKPVQAHRFLRGCYKMPGTALPTRLARSVQVPVVHNGGSTSPLYFRNRESYPAFWVSMPSMINETEPNQDRGVMQGQLSRESCCPYTSGSVQAAVQTGAWPASFSSETGMPLRTALPDKPSSNRWSVSRFVFTPACC